MNTKVRVSTLVRAARRAVEIQPFVVMDVLARAHQLEAAGRRVIHMEIGEPDFTAPPQVVAAAVRALRDGRSAYTATLGLPALREAVAAHYASGFSRNVTPDRIAILPGRGRRWYSRALCLNSSSTGFPIHSPRIG